MSEEQIIHKRLVVETTPFREFLNELGYELKKVLGSGLTKSTIYFVNGKYVISSHSGMRLFYAIDGKIKHVHQGLTVHDELLKFFTKRDYNHDQTYNENLPGLLGRPEYRSPGKSRNKR